MMNQTLQYNKNLSLIKGGTELKFSQIGQIEYPNTYHKLIVKCPFGFRWIKEILGGLMLLILHRIWMFLKIF